MGTGLTIEFRCHNLIPQEFTDDQRKLGLVLDNAVYPLRNCGARVVSKKFDTDVSCPKCSARYHVGGPNAVARIEDPKPEKTP